MTCFVIGRPCKDMNRCDRGDVHSVNRHTYTSLMSCDAHDWARFDEIIGTDGSLVVGLR